jgi:hypothetical protein
VSCDNVRGFMYFLGAFAICIYAAQPERIDNDASGN